MDVRNQLIDTLFCPLIPFLLKVKTVPVGVYPNHLRFDINLPECGMTYVPTVHNISFDNKCARNKYPFKTYYDSEGNNLLFEKPSIDLTQQRIISGRETVQGEAPWTLLLTNAVPLVRYKVGYCTASLITFEWVLTAAHCVVGYVLSMRSPFDEKFLSKAIDF